MDGDDRLCQWRKTKTSRLVFILEVFINYKNNHHSYLNDSIGSDFAAFLAG